MVFQEFGRYLKYVGGGRCSFQMYEPRLVDATGNVNLELSLGLAEAL